MGDGNPEEGRRGLFLDSCFLSLTVVAQLWVAAQQCQFILGGVGPGLQIATLS